MENYFVTGGPFFLGVLWMCGLGFVALFLGAVLALVARKVTALVMPARVLSVGLLLTTPLPLIVGVIGTLYGEQQMADAIAFADVEVREALWAAGSSVAGIPNMFGVCTSMSCLLPASLICLLAGRAGAEQA